MTYTEVLLPSISDMAKKTIEKEELSRKQSGPQRTMEKEAPPLSEHFPPQRWRALTIFAHQNFKSKLLWTIDCYVSQNSSFPNGSIILVMLCLFHHCTLGACNEHSLSFWLNQLVSRVTTSKSIVEMAVHPQQRGNLTQLNFLTRWHFGAVSIEVGIHVIYLGERITQIFGEQKVKLWQTLYLLTNNSSFPLLLTQENYTSLFPRIWRWSCDLSNKL